MIGDFRQKDMVLGGQGAPLVPAFHNALFNKELSKNTFIVNFGGIANITYLPHQPDKNILGFDTGPGNCLMDEWIQYHQNVAFDQGGSWAASGEINEYLFNNLLTDKYFSKAPPKSTGREIFNLSWLKDIIDDKEVLPQDVQTTLCALTVTTIATQIKQLANHGNIYIVGGGKHNLTLKIQLKQQLNRFHFHELPDNIDSDAFEAMAFAWLAYAFDKKIPSNIPAVTGAYKETTLGICFFP